MANISANQWDLANFKIIPAHIMVAEPINGIAAITTPINALMNLDEAQDYASSLEKGRVWEIPAIEELQTILSIYGILGLNNKLKKPVWSSTSDTYNNLCAQAFDFNTGKPVPTSPNKNHQLEVICVSYC